MTVSEEAATPTTRSGTRRERLRGALIDDIKACANRQLEAGGPDGVTLRGIAREVGVSPAALYSYFDSLDALLTAVVTDHYEDLANAVAGAAGTDASGELGTRLLTAIAAYRAWALEHPAAFRLLFAGPRNANFYPDDGPAVTAAMRVFVPMLAILLEGWERGLIPLPPAGPRVDPHVFVDKFGLEITSDQLRDACIIWGTFHGLVTLELGGHLNLVDPAELFDAAMRTQLRAMSLPGL
jgi:AcrR family transcriptional regulator